MTLWMLFTAMLIVALLFVLPPLLRQPRASGPGQNEINIVLHRKRLTELEADLTNGVLSEAQVAQAREDLERELLQELAGTADTEVKATPSSSRASAMIVALLVPALALGLYYKLGNWRALESTSSASMAAGNMQNSAPQDTAPAGTTPDGTMPPIDEMIKRLEKKLKDDPSSAQGWLMLGRSYVYTNRYPDAVRAYAQAEVLTNPPDAQLYAEYAEAMSLANGDRLAGGPERLVEKSLKLQPDNPNALWLAGMIAFQKADYPGALKYWEPLQKVTKPDSDQGRVLTDYLAQARAGKPLDKIMPNSTEPAAQEPESAPAPATASTSATLKVHVALDPALTAKAAPDDTVFIFARAVQGPPMPLAIVRKQVKDLPTDVTLDDSLAMMPAMKLSNFAQVVVGARISKSGNATPASGDLQGLSDSLPTQNAQAVDITINQMVP